MHFSAYFAIEGPIFYCNSICYESTFSLSTRGWDFTGRLGPLGGLKIMRGAQNNSRMGPHGPIFPVKWALGAPYKWGLFLQDTGQFQITRMQFF